MFKISPVLFDINRSFKHQNTISLKTGIFIKVSEMRPLREDVTKKEEWGMGNGKLKWEIENGN